MCEQMRIIKFQCCVCRLPHLSEFEEPSHGIHKDCMRIAYPEQYKQMYEVQNEDKKIK